MRWKQQLGPIHYNAELFGDLIDRIEEYTDADKFEVTAKWDDKKSEVTLDNPREILDTKSIPNRIQTFDLYLRGQKGRIKLTVDSRRGREFHRLIVEGEDEGWVRKNVQNIHEFERIQRNKIRKYLNTNILRSIQALLVGSIIATAGPYIITNLNKVIQYPIPNYIIYLSVFQIGMLFAVETSRWLYPHTLLIRNGADPLHKKAISIAMPILSIISVALGITTLFL